MSDTKRYSIVIEGVETQIKNVTSLVSALNKLESKNISVNQVTSTSTSIRKESAKALTDEEKAILKLEQTTNRLNELESQTARQQLEVTEAIRVRRHELNREIRINQLAEGSLARKGMELTNLRKEYDNLSQSERENIEIGGAMLNQIQALDAEYKKLREETGRFQDSVGNYEKANKGLTTLTQSGIGLAKSMQGAALTVALFSDNSEESAKASQTLAKVLAILQIISSVNNNLIKSGIAQKQADNIIEKARTIQTIATTKALELQTTATIGATIKQRIYNAVISANPLGLFLLAITSVVGGIALLGRETSNTTEQTKKYTSAIDGSRFATEQARDAHDQLQKSLQDVRIEIQLIKGEISDYEANLLKLANSTQSEISSIFNKYKSEQEQILKDWDNEVNSFWFRLKALFSNGEKTTLKYQQRLSENREKHQKEAEAAQVMQAATETRINAEKNAEIIKSNEDVRAANISGLEGEITRIELARKREIQAAETTNKEIAEKNKTKSENERISLHDIAAINEKYTQQIAKVRGDAANAWKIKREQELKAEVETLQKDIEALRKVEDEKTSLIGNKFEKRHEQARLAHERRNADLKYSLETDKTLTATQKEALNAQLLLSDELYIQSIIAINNDEKKAFEEKEKQKGELIQKTIDGNMQAVGRYMQSLESELSNELVRIGEIVRRNKGGFELIDVKGTQSNLKEVSNALESYIKGQNNALELAAINHAKNLSLLEKGTQDYADEVANYEAVTTEINNNIILAQRDMAANTKLNNDIISESYQELSHKVGTVANVIVDSISGITGIYSTLIDEQIERLNEQLEYFSNRYDEIGQKRDANKDRIIEIEEELTNASGARSAILRDQLQMEMQNKQELEKEEIRIARDKERTEAKIAQKQRQAKRAQLISDIASGISGTALAVINALAMKPFIPLGLASSIIAGTMGAAQTAIMTRQLAKMEDGGELVGRSHANGGMRIQGTNIEVEGGEFVVNKRSTAANRELLNFINDNRRAIGINDLFGTLPAKATDFAYKYPDENSNQNIIEAIKEIDFKPIVAVTDFQRAEKQLAETKAYAGLKE